MNQPYPVPKKVCIVVKKSNPEAIKHGKILGQFLIKKGLLVFSPEASLGFTPKPVEEISNDLDLVVVLGGDGTFLSATRHMDSHTVPILGINMGSLGFLTEWKLDEVQAAVEEILSGKGLIEERPILSCEIRRNGKLIETDIAVNDIVVAKAAIARLIDIKVSINQTFVATYKSDGIIVATAMGSTAYNLAAGGPIIPPTTQVMTLTPICPHALTTRPLVLSNVFQLHLELTDNCLQTIMTLDGQSAFDLLPKDQLTIKRKDGEQLQLFRPRHRDYFSVLREKLKFGERN